MGLVNPPAGTFPFGKHRGHLLEEVADDARYCRWLFGQSWFREDHPDLYKCLKDLTGLYSWMAEARAAGYY